MLEAAEERGRLMRRATSISVATALLLVLVKTAAWLATGSVSLLSSLIDSLLDAAASLVMLLAVRRALVPADREHRFGHGKAEPLAALAQAAFVAGSAVFLLLQAASRLLHPEPLREEGVGIAVMAFSIAVTLALTTYQQRMARRTGSLAIAADRLHYIGDLLVNVAVIVALLLAGWLGWTWADPVFAIGIAAVILRSAWHIARGALDMLMDRELPDSDRERIKAIVLAEPEVRGLHDLRTRAAGPQRFVQLHLELDGRLTLAAAHGIADRLEKRIATALGGADVLIHEDLFDPAYRRKIDLGPAQPPHDGVDLPPGPRGKETPS